MQYLGELMSQLLDIMVPVTSLAASMAPVMQEFYLFCFFCLGFYVMRTEVVRRQLNGTPKPHMKKLDAEDENMPTYSIDHMRRDSAHGRHHQLLQQWASMQRPSGEALSLAVSALLALGRSEEVGCFIADAIAAAHHLKPQLHQVVRKISEAIQGVSCDPAAIALRHIFEDACACLDGAALEALLVGMARINDEGRVSALLMKLANQSAWAATDSSKVFAWLAEAFSSVGNFRAALRHLKEAFMAMCEDAASSTREVTAAAATVVAAVAKAKNTDIEIKELVELLESGPPLSEEALKPMVEWARQEYPDDETLMARIMAFNRVGGPAPASCDKEEVRQQLADLAKTGKAPTEAGLLRLFEDSAGAGEADLVERALQLSREWECISATVLVAAVRALVSIHRPEYASTLYNTAFSKKGELDETNMCALIRAAGDINKPDLAKELFHSLPKPALRHYTSLLCVCERGSEVAEVLEILEDKRSCDEADMAAYNSALSACVAATDSVGTKLVFTEMKAAGRIDVITYNVLLKRLVDEKPSITEADRLLDDMHRNGMKPNISTYNALLNCVFACGDVARAWRTIEEMERSALGVDATTLSIFLKGFKRERHMMTPRNFERVVGLMKKFSFRTDEILVNVLLEVALLLQSPDTMSLALSAIEGSGWSIQRQCSTNVCASIIKGYGQIRRLDKAWKVWNEVTQEKRLSPSEQLYGQMIDACVSNHRLSDAVQLLEEMKVTHSDRINSQGFAVAYAMVIRGFAQKKESAKALSCYEEMKEQGMKVGLVIFNTLVDACSRVGDMECAAKLFCDMKNADCVPDLITYSTLIKGYCVCGELNQAMDLFHLMRQKHITPDAIVFNSLLDGCAKASEVDLCERVLQQMEEAGVALSNYSASILIKLYGRRRDLTSAYRIIDEMPVKYGFRPNAAVYTCLMSTCISCHRMELAMELRTRMMDDRVVLDERTYSTLLRGALKVNSVDWCLQLLEGALNDGNGHNLDKDLVDSVISLVRWRRAWNEQNSKISERLQKAGFTVQWTPEQQEAHGDQPQPKPPVNNRGPQNQYGDQRRSQGHNGAASGNFRKSWGNEQEGRYNGYSNRRRNTDGY